MYTHKPSLAARKFNKLFIFQPFVCFSMKSHIRWYSCWYGPISWVSIMLNAPAHILPMVKNTFLLVHRAHFCVCINVLITAYAQGSIISFLICLFVCLLIFLCKAYIPFFSKFSCCSCYCLNLLLPYINMDNEDKKTCVMSIATLFSTFLLSFCV